MRVESLAIPQAGPVRFTLGHAGVTTVEMNTLALQAPSSPQGRSVEETLIAATAFVTWAYAILGFTFFFDVSHLFGTAVIIASMNVVAALRLTLKN
jgi:hypothetical protein